MTVPGPLPCRRRRCVVAAYLGVDEAYLWPDALTHDQVANASESEIINIYPARWRVPSDIWRMFFDNAEREIGVLAYSGLFIPEDTGIQRVFRRKAADGVNIRILIGDPDSAEVTQRGIDEGIDTDMGARCRNAIVLHQPLRNIDGIEFRTALADAGGVRRWRCRIPRARLPRARLRRGSRGGASLHHTPSTPCRRTRLSEPVRMPPGFAASGLTWLLAMNDAPLQETAELRSLFVGDLTLGWC